MSAPWWIWVAGGVFWAVVVVSLWPYDVVGRLREIVRPSAPDDHYYP